MPFTPGKVVRFPRAICAKCRLRSRCSTSKTGRSVSIHPDEKLLLELRQRQTTALGRGKLRERVSVEHTLAHIGQLACAIVLVISAKVKIYLTYVVWH